MATKAQALAALDKHGAQLNQVKGVEGVGLGAKKGRFFIVVHPVLGAAPSPLPTRVTVVVEGKQVQVPVVVEAP